MLCVKIAVTDRSAVMLTTQAPEPVQAPVQFVNVQPDAGVGVSVTLVPSTYASLQSLPQLIPPGDDVTVPCPPSPTVRT